MYNKTSFFSRQSQITFPIAKKLQGGQSHETHPYSCTFSFINRIIHSKEFSILLGKTWKMLEQGDPKLNKGRFQSRDFFKSWLSFTRIFQPMSKRVKFKSTSTNLCEIARRSPLKLQRWCCFSTSEIMLCIYSHDSVLVIDRVKLITMGRDVWAQRGVSMALTNRKAEWVGVPGPYWFRQRSRQRCLQSWQVYWPLPSESQGPW